MPNWCYNVLTFSGENEDKANEIFSELEDRCNETNRGHIPDCVLHDNNVKYLFDVSNVGGVIHFQSKWTPPLHVLEVFGKKINVTWRLEYSEPGMGIYGVAIYNPEQGLTDYTLDFDDFDLYKYNEDIDRYIFDGKEYEVEEEILEKLLTNKFGVI